MSAETWSAIAAGLAAISAAGSVYVTVRAGRAARQRLSNDLERTFQDRHYAFYPRLVDTIGLDDELDPELRKLLVPYFMFYAHVWDSYERGLAAPDPTWKGLRGSFEWWARTTEGRAAWDILRRYEADDDTYWPPGFVPYLDAVMREGAVTPSTSGAAAAPTR